ncbi:MAG: hypothetical protein Q9213_006959 [Squamulea squamosa]
MATNIPAALKSADIARFAQRAGQVEKAKPSIAYWCNYWIVNQLISKNLHNADDDCTRYTSELMDKLERIKTEHATDDTIVDDVAAQVYVEQFALETFQRAENAMRANKVSRQTADTFLAAIVFLELRQIWEPLDAETSSKTKYAKYHALRIAKAIRAGEDPNLSNPAPEPSPAQKPQDQDVQMLDENPRQPPSFQPTVEDVPDDHDRIERHLAQRSSIDQSLHPSRAPSIPRPPDPPQSPPSVPTPPEQTVKNYYQQSSVPEDSPLQSPERGRDGSIGGGYFPRAPESSEPSQVTNGHLGMGGHDYASAPDLPDASSLPPPMSFDTSAPPILPTDVSSPSLPPSFNYKHPSAPSAPTSSPHVQGGTPFQASGYPQPSAPSLLPQPTPAPLRQTAPPPPPPSFSQQPIHAPPAVVDEEAIAKAQKHARWAISALNFEDINTAVKELRGALESLGASNASCGMMSSKEENLERTYNTSSDEDNVDWDSRASIKSLSPRPIACINRASHQSGPRLLTRQEIPGGGSVFWGDPSGRSGVGYGKRAVHGNIRPASRRSTEGPMAQPAAKYPSMPPKDGIVIQGRKASNNAPTQPGESRFWELRSNSKRQHAKQTVHLVHTPPTDDDKGASLSDKNNERDANDLVPQRRLSLIVKLRLREKKSLIVTLRFTKQKHIHQLQTICVDVDDKTKQRAVDRLTTDEGNPYCSGKNDSSHDETSAEDSESKQQTRKRQRITPNSIYNETALEDNNDFIVSTPDIPLNDLPRHKAAAAGLFYPSPASIRSTKSKSTPTTQQSPIIRAITNRSMTAEATEIAVHAENDVRESSVDQRVRRATAERDLALSSKTVYPLMNQISPFELGYPLFVVTGDTPLESLRQVSRSGAEELHEDDFALNRLPIGNKKRLAGAILERDNEQQQTKRPKAVPEENQDLTAPVHDLTAVVQAEQGSVSLTQSLPSKPLATGADLPLRNYGKRVEESSTRHAAARCRTRTNDGQSVHPSQQLIHPVYISSEEDDSDIDFDNIQSQILADALSPSRTNPAGTIDPKSSAIITSHVTTKSVQPHVQSPAANTTSPTTPDSEAVPRSPQPINRHSTATRTINPRQPSTAFSDSPKNRDTTDPSRCAIARQQDAGTTATAAPTVTAINRAKSPIPSNIDVLARNAAAEAAMLIKSIKPMVAKPKETAESVEVTTTTISTCRVQSNIQAQETEPVAVAPANGLPNVATPPPTHPTLPQENSKRTYLLITATSQWNMAPVWIPYSSIQTHDSAHLLNFLSAECGLEDGLAETVANVSATFTWSGAELRLRRYRWEDDWKVFEDVVRAAWEVDKGGFEGGCFVRMLVHVG